MEREGVKCKVCEKYKVFVVFSLFLDILLMCFDVFEMKERERERERERKRERKKERVSELGMGRETNTI